MRKVTLMALAAIALGGCGGSSGSSTSQSGTAASQPSAAATTAAKPEACPQTLLLLQSQGKDLGGIVGQNVPQAAYNTAASDTDSTLTSLQLLSSQVSDPTTKTQLDAGIAAETRMQTAIRSMAAGDFSSAVGELTGDAPEVGRLIKLVIGLC